MFAKCVVKRARTFEIISRSTTFFIIPTTFDIILGTKLHFYQVNHFFHYSSTFDIIFGTKLHFYQVNHLFHYSSTFDIILGTKLHFIRSITFFIILPLLKLF